MNVDTMIKELLDLEFEQYVHDLVKDGVPLREAQKIAAEEISAEYDNLRRKSIDQKLAVWKKKNQEIQNRIKDNTMMMKFQKMKF